MDLFGLLYHVKTQNDRGNLPLSDILFRRSQVMAFKTTRYEPNLISFDYSFIMITVTANKMATEIQMVLIPNMPDSTPPTPAPTAKIRIMLKK